MNDTSASRSESMDPVGPSISPRVRPSVAADWNELAPPFAGMRQDDPREAATPSAESDRPRPLEPRVAGDATEEEAPTDISAFAPDESLEPDPWELPPVEAEDNEAADPEEAPWEAEWSDESQAEDEPVAAEADDADPWGTEVAEAPAIAEPYGSVVAEDDSSSGEGAGPGSVPAPESVLRDSADRIAGMAERFRAMGDGDLSRLGDDPLALLVAGYLIGQRDATAPEGA